MSLKPVDAEPILNLANLNSLTSVILATDTQSISHRNRVTFVLSNGQSPWLDELERRSKQTQETT